MKKIDNKFNWPDAQICREKYNSLWNFLHEFGTFKHKFWYEGTGNERYLNAEMEYWDGRIVWAQYDESKMKARRQLKKFEEKKPKEIVGKLEGKWSEWFDI